VKKRSLLAVLAILFGSAGIAAGADFRRGDATADGALDISDGVRILGAIFLGEPFPGCSDALDANDDGRADITDAIFLFEHLFLGGRPPPPPYPGCGADPTADDLDCRTYPPCFPGDAGVQASGSIYRIHVPDPAGYNGRLVIWAHGFQDAGEPVGIPEWQMHFGDIYLPDLLASAGFAFATNSYSKTGLAVRQGVADIRDLVDIFVAGHGVPEKIYVTGASEGGLITALLVEGYPEVFAGGLAACGPVGDFAFQIRYFGNVRVLFEYFFPGLVPGDPFDPPPSLVAGWSGHYETVVRPALLAPANRRRLEELAATARLPVDPADFLATADLSVLDALSYCVLDIADVEATLGGFPFDNRDARYEGSDDDEALNRDVIRVAADPAALEEMDRRYDTSGLLARPLMTVHTTLDQQVPYEHETMYEVKCADRGTAELHGNFPVERFGHCNFTPQEVLFAFGVLLYAAGDGDLVEEIQGLLGG
jgi:hypothetical protein